MRAGAHRRGRGRALWGVHLLFSVTLFPIPYYYYYYLKKEQQQQGVGALGRWGSMGTFEVTPDKAALPYGANSNGYSLLSSI